MYIYIHIYTHIYTHMHAHTLLRAPETSWKARPGTNDTSEGCEAWTDTLRLYLEEGGWRRRAGRVSVERGERDGSSVEHVR